MRRTSTEQLLETVVVVGTTDLEGGKSAATASGEPTGRHLSSFERETEMESERRTGWSEWSALLPPGAAATRNGSGDDDDGGGEGAGAAGRALPFEAVSGSRVLSTLSLARFSSFSFSFSRALSSRRSFSRPRSSTALLFSLNSPRSWLPFRLRELPSLAMTAEIDVGSSRPSSAWTGRYSTGRASPGPPR